MEEKKVVLEIRNLSKVYEGKGVNVKALTDVSLDVYQGETIGIVGESGCGKTTLGRCVVRGIDASSGQVLFHTEEDGVIDFLKTTSSQMKKYRRDIQMIFPGSLRQPGPPHDGVRHHQRAFALQLQHEQAGDRGGRR